MTDFADSRVERNKLKMKATFPESVKGASLNYRFFDNETKSNIDALVKLAERSKVPFSDRFQLGPYIMKLKLSNTQSGNRLNFVSFSNFRFG